MTAEIPIWVDGAVQWLSGVDRRTTCRDVLELFVEGAGGGDVCNYELIERWRQVERPLDLDSRLLKIWSHWGDEQKEVRLCLRCVDNEADSGRGSPVGATPSLKRRRHRKGGSKHSYGHSESLHPRRLAELGGFDREEFQEYQLRRLEAEDVGDYAYGEKTYATTQEAGHVRKKNGHRTCSGTGTLHSTAIEGRTKKCCSKRASRPKVRNSENIEKLMKLILAQGATIQTQLQKLKEREQQIDNIEVERHKQRVEKNGRNYLLETYLEGLKDAEVPGTDEEKGNDSGVHTEAGSEQTGQDKDSNSLRLRRNCVESNSRKDRGKQSENQNEHCERPPRSRSETRSSDVEGNKPLVRTLSEQAIAGTYDGSKCEEAATKEDEEDIVELRRVQSQVEMWEKVLKINKKLEKEEENLVKLHIQIRRIQSENIKIAKDRNSSDPISLPLQKQLESLRTDLDQNSKEIYRNFTQLIQDDEKVVKKQNYLAELIQDLERTDHEHNLLAEMVAASGAGLLPEEHIGISLQVKGQTKTQSPDLIPGQSSLPVQGPTPILEPTPPLSDPVLLQNVGQRYEESSKPKILKISFDENVIESDSNGIAARGKDPSPVLARNIKGILKNRNTDTFHLGDIEKVPINYGSNISSQETSPKIGKSTSLQEAPSFEPAGNTYYNPAINQTNSEGCSSTAFNQPVSESSNSSVYSHQNVHNPYGHGPSTSYTVAMENPYPFPMVNRREDIYQSANPPNAGIPNQIRYSRTNQNGPIGSQQIVSDGIRSGVVVTTKATVHHDTDSSGSSDTSGLSSMYSASPTVEEPTYVLNTLV